jgi:hypothetical protein
VGAQENFKPGGNTAIGTLSAKSSYPSKMFQTFSKLMNPEDKDPEENWEEDTNDTEIMRNINSLLDSDLFEGKDSASVQINYLKERQHPTLG